MAGRQSARTDKPTKVEPFFLDYPEKHLDGLSNRPGRQGNNQNFIMGNIGERRLTLMECIIYVVFRFLLIKQRLTKYGNYVRFYYNFGR